MEQEEYLKLLQVGLLVQVELVERLEAQEEHLVQLIRLD